VRNLLIGSRFTRRRIEGLVLRSTGFGEWGSGVGIEVVIGWRGREKGRREG